MKHYRQKKTMCIFRFYRFNNIYLDTKSIKISQYSEMLGENLQFKPLAAAILKNGRHFVRHYETKVKIWIQRVLRHGH